MSDPVADALVWLERHLDHVPAALQTKMVDAMRQTVGATSPVCVFQNAADALLLETLRDGKHSDPLTLLAADALVTYVCEYTSEQEPESLSRLQ